jgi:hypothetical protein
MSRACFASTGFRNVEVEDGASFRARPREIAAVLLCEHAARMEPV